MIREGEHESSRRLKTQHFIERVIVQFNRLQELDEAHYLRGFTFPSLRIVWSACLNHSHDTWLVSQKPLKVLKKFNNTLVKEIYYSSV